MTSPRRAPLGALAVAALFALLLGGRVAPAAPGPGSTPPGAASSAAPSTAPAEVPPADEPPAQAYKRHMDNGVRLWGEKNYRAAITEFDAAYKAEPKASPLVNIALCRRALFDYPQAVEALQKALTVHGDTLDAKVREAAEREMRDLEALIGYVTIKTEPAGAELLVDGVERGRADGSSRIALSAGPHDIEARHVGHAPAKIHIEVTAGQHSREVVLELAPSVGKVRVVPRETAAFVEVDRQSPVQAGWEGSLDPGVHVIRVFQPGGASASLQIAVRAGEQIVVTQREDGTLSSPAAVASDAPAVVVPPADDEPRTGFFLHGDGALLFIGGTPPEGITAKSGGGIGLGLRIGYRVADWAAIEAGGQLSSVGGTGELRLSDPTLAGYDDALGFAAYPDARYTLQSLRLGAMVRLLLPGRTVVRFVAAAGGGLVGDELSWALPSTTEAPDSALAADTTEPIARAPDSASGWNGYGQLDVGIELEFSNVFFGLTVQHILQGTRGLTGGYLVGTGDYTPYPGPIFLIGPALHVGYGFW